jgi:uncharacterized membrane protein
MSLTPDKSSTGLEPNVAAGLAVLLGWVGGLVFFLLEKDSKFVKFYGFQNMITCLLAMLSPIPVLGWLLGIFVFVMWIMQLINAFGGKVFKVPIIGDMAMNQAMGMSGGGSSSAAAPRASSAPAADDDSDFGDDD